MSSLFSASPSFLLVGSAGPSLLFRARREPLILKFRIPAAGFSSLTSSSALFHVLPLRYSGGFPISSPNPLNGRLHAIHSFPLSYHPSKLSVLVSPPQVFPLATPFLNVIKQRFSFQGHLVSRLRDFYRPPVPPRPPPRSSPLPVPRYSTLTNVCPPDSSGPTSTHLPSIDSLFARVYFLPFCCR